MFCGKKPAWFWADITAEDMVKGFRLNTHLPGYGLIEKVSLDIDQVLPSCHSLACPLLTTWLSWLIGAAASSFNPSRLLFDLLESIWSLVRLSTEPLNYAIGCRRVYSNYTPSVSQGCSPLFGQAHMPLHNFYLEPQNIILVLLKSLQCIFSLLIITNEHLMLCKCANLQPFYFFFFFWCYVIQWWNIINFLWYESLWDIYNGSILEFYCKKSFSLKYTIVALCVFVQKEDIFDFIETCTSLKNK